MYGPQYNFERKLGQIVVLHVTSGEHIGKIEEIKPYYTIVDSEGKLWAGTPTTLSEYKAR